MRESKSAAMKASRSWLKENIKKNLVPALEDRGFESKSVRRDLRFDLPFGTLRRHRLGRVDIVEIDLEKYNRQSFRICFGSAPPGDWDIDGVGIFKNDDILTGWLDESYELYRYPRFMTYFGRRWPWQKPATEREVENTVKAVVTLLPEVEQALFDGKIGPHVRYVDMRPRR